jgi:hypothetical protein
LQHNIFSSQMSLHEFEFVLHWQQLLLWAVSISPNQKHQGDHSSGPIVRGLMSRLGTAQYICFSKWPLKLDVVAHTWILATWGEGRDWEDLGSRPTQAKILWDPMSTNDWAQGHILVISAMQESTNRSLLIQTSLGIKVRPYFKNN